MKCAGSGDPRTAGCRAFASTLCVALLIGAAAGFAQQQDVERRNEMTIDPMSVTGPDPADKFTEIYIDQKLDAQVPLDLPFLDEAGNAVKLGDYFGDKPVVLALVYYECPMLCTLVMNGMSAGFDGAANHLEIGDDYEVVSVSIDPGETPELARAKKDTYMQQVHRAGGEKGWHFLTGGQEAIETLAESVGFRYYYDAQSDQYAHASGVMILTPQGKVSSYYLGIEYLPANLETAITQAAQGGIGKLSKQLVLLCFRYDPTTGKYGLLILNTLRLGGTLTVLAIAGFWLLHYMKTSRARKGAADSDPGVPLENGLPGNSH